MAFSENDYWSDNLIDASLDGVDFLISTRTVKGGRAFARRRFPYRDGQSVEDTGREPYVFELEIPLYRGVSDSLYPARQVELLAVFDDAEKKGEVEYVDPEFGALNVKVSDWSWKTEPSARNGGLLSLVLEERTLDRSITDELRLNSTLQIMVLAAINLDLAIDQSGLDLTELPEEDFGNWEDKIDDLTSKFTDVLLAADDIAAEIDAVTMTLNRLMAFDLGDEISKWSIVNSVVDLLGALHLYGEEQSKGGSGNKQQIKFIDWTVPSDMSKYDIAMRLYNDSIRADEIEFNNPTPNPMNYPRGTRLKVLSA